jgi:hypothetical protein
VTVRQPTSTKIIQNGLLFHVVAAAATAPLTLPVKKGPS